MKLAVMQPYFFPYLGYFQLINAVDTFVIYDDVAFIKQGWVNRNFLLKDCHPQRFTVCLSNASSFRPIYKTYVTSTRWQSKFLKSLQQAYSKAPYFHSVFELTEHTIVGNPSSIAELALGSLTAVMDYLDLKTDVHPTSRIYGNTHLKGQERVLDICLRESAHTYINLPGGRLLYDRAAFSAQGVDLYYLQPAKVSYRQFDCEFVPNLSILDVLMFNERTVVSELLNACAVVR